VNSFVESLDLSVSELLNALAEHPTARRLLEGDVNAQEYAVHFSSKRFFMCDKRVRFCAERVNDWLQCAARQRWPSFFYSRRTKKKDTKSGYVADLEAIDRPMDERRLPRACTAVAAYIAWNHFQVEAGWPLGLFGNGLCSRIVVECTRRDDCGQPCQEKPYSWNPARRAFFERSRRR
jgi:hypothetical protein